MISLSRSRSWRSKNVVCFSKYSYVHREAFAVLRARCTRNSFERDGLTNKRRVGRLEAVALEGPQIQLVVELILSIELGHEVLDRRRRLRGPVRRVMCTICGVRQVRHGLLEADVVAEL